MWLTWRHDPDNKVHGVNMGHTWDLSAPEGPHVGPMNLAIRVSLWIVQSVAIPRMQVQSQWNHVGHHSTLSGHQLLDNAGSNVV